MCVFVCVCVCLCVLACLIWHLRDREHVCICVLKHASLHADREEVEEILVSSSIELAVTTPTCININCNAVASGHQRVLGVCRGVW